MRVFIPPGLCQEAVGSPNKVPERVWSRDGIPVTLPSGSHGTAYSLHRYISKMTCKATGLELIAFVILSLAKLHQHLWFCILKFFGKQVLPFDPTPAASGFSEQEVSINTHSMGSSLISQPLMFPGCFFFYIYCINIAF